MPESVLCQGYLNYQAQSVESSIYRNGKVSLGRLLDGRSQQYKGTKDEKHAVNIHDARTSSSNPTLDTHGFTLVNDDLNTPPDFFDSHAVVNEYYKHCEELVKQHTGASHTFAFDHNVRTSNTKHAENTKLKNATQALVQAPAAIVHADYTLTSAFERITQLTKAPKKNDTRSQSQPLIAEELLEKANRYGIVNVWRNIKQDEVVRKNPLVCCAPASVSEKDLVTLEIHYEDRIGENYFVKHNEQHQWFMYPDMNINEAILLKTWDSDGTFAKRDKKGDGQGDKATFAVHSGLGDFVDVDMASLPDRWSIEVRVVVLYCDQ